MTCDPYVLQQIIDCSHQIVEVVDAETYDLLYINQKAKEFFGVPDYIWGSQKCYSVLWNRDTPCEHCPLKFAHLDNPDTMEHKHEGRTYSFKTRLILWKNRPAVIIYIQDITEISNSEEIYSSEIEAIINSITNSEGIAHLDLDSNNILRIKRAIDLYVDTSQMAADGLLHVLSSYITSESERIQCRNLFSPSNLRLIFETGQRTFSRDFAITKQSGEKAWIRLTASMLRNPRNNHLECILFAINCTNEYALKESIEHMNELNRALSSDFGCVISIDLLDGTLTTHKLNTNYNAASLMHSEVVSFEKFFKAYMENFVLEEYHNEMLETMRIENLRYQFSNGKRYINIRYKVHPNKQGQENFEIILLPIRYNDPYHLVLGSKCIDDLILKEEQEKEQIQAARLAAEEANKAKTSFLFNMSHDIRTPMNAIIGFTELIRKHIDDPQAIAGYLDKMQSANQFLLSLINNVLEMARIESGKETLDEEPININDAALELANIFEQRLQTKGIAFHHSIQLQHPAVMLDLTKMREVMLNLLSNAEKYTPAGGRINMAVTELPCSQTGCMTLQIIIEDNGIGMSKQFLPTLFDPFSREHNTTESKVGGTGLGMPIVKHLVELMNGAIQVESELGKGTRFIILTTHRIAAIPEAADQQKSAIDNPNFVGKRILMAEDNELNAEIAIEILQDAGFKVDRVEDGIACVNMIEKTAATYYDLILMDIQMPNMDGYKATRIIRRLNDPIKACIPIVAMTANAFDEDRHNAFEVGMNGHIAKPFELEKMFSTIAEVLHLK